MDGIEGQNYGIVPGRRVSTYRFAELYGPLQMSMF
jgi:hypothetical protein